MLSLSYYRVKNVFQNGNVVRQLEDKALKSLLRADPDKGIEQAIRQYGGLAKAVIVRFLGDGADAEECLADTFAGLWRHIGEFDPERGSLKSYLTVMARNCAVSRLRSLRRHPPVIPPEEAELGQRADESGNPEGRENAVLLREALLELEPSDRELMIRRYFYGESVKEAAGHLGFTVKYAENRLFRSRQKLKKVLLERGVIV